MAAAPALYYAATAAAAAVSATAAVRQGQSQQNMLNYQAEVSRQNAMGATWQGNAAADLQSKQDEMRLGAARAAVGAAGVQSNSASAVDVLTSSARNMTMDNLMTQYNYKLKGLGYQDQAQLDSAGASNSMPAAYTSATSSLIGGASQAAFYYGGGYQMPQQGGMGG